MSKPSRYRPTNVYDIGRFRAWLNTSHRQRDAEEAQAIEQMGVVNHARRRAQCDTYRLGQMKRLHRFPFVLIERYPNWPEPGPADWVHASGYPTHEQAEGFAVCVRSGPGYAAVVLPTKRPPAVVPPGENVVSLFGAPKKAVRHG